MACGGISKSFGASSAIKSGGCGKAKKSCGTKKSCKTKSCNKGGGSNAAKIDPQTIIKLLLTQLLKSGDSQQVGNSGYQQAGSLA